MNRGRTYHIICALTGALLLAGCANATGRGEVPSSGVTLASTSAEAAPAASDEATLPSLTDSGAYLPVTPLTSLTDAQWQCTVSFPDWRDSVIDTTLAVNGMYSFRFWHGQGTLYLDTRNHPGPFRMYVNNTPVDTSQITDGNLYAVDFSAAAVDGINTMQVSGLLDNTEEEKLTVYIPYPTVLTGTPAEAGYNEQSLALLDALIASDCAHGFPGAQLSVVAGGRLIHERAYGRVNAYRPDGTFQPDAPAVTVDTLFDLASVTKMIAVNFSLQRLAGEGRIDIDAPVSTYLDGAYKEEGITIRDLLCHRAGLPPDPRFFDPSNALFTANDASEAAREATLEALCHLPFIYEPRTDMMYSDADYMLLCLIIERVTGERLDRYLSRTFFAPAGLTHITYNPLQNGFTAADCAATELNGNTRDGFAQFDGIRTETVQGEVHDEKTYYSMAGISGHAGLFSNASDLARLSSAMLTGGYGETHFFSINETDLFTSPDSQQYPNWGLGWYRQADMRRVWYFGTQSSSQTIGHQGWTGTLLMIDPKRDLVIAYLTNTVNSPVTNGAVNPNRFDGGFYTAASLGFVPQILSVGSAGEDVTAQLADLLIDMTDDAFLLIPEETDPATDHPAIQNARSKMAVLTDYAAKSDDPDFVARAYALRDKWSAYLPEDM